MVDGYPLALGPPEYILRNNLTGSSLGDLAGNEVTFSSSFDEEDFNPDQSAFIRFRGADESGAPGSLIPIARIFLPAGSCDIIRSRPVRRIMVRESSVRPRKPRCR